MSFEFLIHCPLLGVIETLGTVGTIAFYASLAASTTGALLSNQAQRDAAKQTELNADAQSKALSMEKQRKATEDAENRRRLAVQERRERATQMADLSSAGFVTTTGTPLAIISDTMEAQNERRADMVNNDNLDQWELLTQGNTILQEGRSRASAMRSEAGASLLSDIGTTARYGSTLAPAKKTTTKP